MLQEVHVVGVSPLQIGRLVFERAGNFINAEAAESAEDAVEGVWICEDVYERIFVWSLRCLLRCRNFGPPAAPSFQGLTPQDQ